MTVHLLFPLLLAVASEPRPCCPQPQGQETGGLLLIHLVPKRFATLVEVDPVRRKVKLHVEGEEEAADWDVVPDAEIKVHGWWGRLDQLHEGDRVWVWFQVDREKERTAVLFLADEISEQKIHREPYVLETVNELAGTITFGAKRREGRTLKLDSQLEVTARGADEVYLQAAGDELRLLVPESRLFDLQAEQRSRMHAIWKEEGLPSTVSVLHPFGGELELMVDHQGMRWSRSLRPGDEVELIVDPPIRGVVAKVEPWRERTRLRLAVRGEEQGVLAAGQRLGVRMQEPPASILQSRFPPDLDLARTRDERIDWLLASTYCTCNIPNDFCTGMLYTLANCDETQCGMPRQFRAQVAELIDRGLDDRAIFVELERLRGASCLEPHLLR